MKKQIGLITLTALLVTFVAFSGVAAAQAGNVQVLFFEAPGCYACTQALPIVQTAVAKYGVSLAIYDVSTGVGKGMATANGVSTTPTIIVSGAQSATFVGSVTQAQMEAAIKAAIGTPKPTPTPTPTPTPVIKKQATPTPAPVIKKQATPTPAPVIKKQATPTPVKAAISTVAKASTQPTMEVVAASTTPTNPSQTVPEFSLLGLGAPALVIGAIYLFLRRR